LRQPHRASRRSDLAVAAAVFAVLGDETRLALVSRLCAEGPLSIAKLTTGRGMTRQAVTKHLRALEDVRLVRSTHRGRESVWEVERARLAETRRHLEAISTQWDDALARLKSFVER
jgi:DNA-binding transcriptional ArsR family regulator